jgi:hypothetical protein
MAATGLFMLASTGAFAADEGVTTKNDAVQDYASAPLNMLFPKYEDFQEIAKKGPMGFRPLYRALSKRDEPGVISFSFEHEGKTYDLDADWEGFIDFRPTPDMLKTNPVVTVNQPKGTMAMNLSIGLDVPLQKTYQLKELHEQTHAAWKKVKKLGGMMSFLAPSHTDLLVVFEDDCEYANWTVRGAGPDADGAGKEARIPFTDKKARKAETISFSCTPKRIVFQ